MSAGRRNCANSSSPYSATTFAILSLPSAAASKMIARTPLDDKAALIVPLVQSSIARMAGLIDNVLDFARGRLGDGLTLTRASWNLETIILQAVTELQTSQPDRRIETEFFLHGPVDCDGSRLAQIVSNLVANALTHGAADIPVQVRATDAHGIVEISVSNGGAPISPLALERLFEPFERGAVKPGQQGLGLGLYIATQIAEAHGGTLSAESSPEETRFTFRMERSGGTTVREHLSAARSLVAAGVDLIPEIGGGV